MNWQEQSSRSCETAVSDEPLHHYVLDLGEWWACQHPEKPYDRFQIYDVRCRACLIKAQVDLAIYGDRPMFDPDSDRTEYTTTLSELIDGAK
jgi:hypothetical protein